MLRGSFKNVMKTSMLNPERMVHPNSRELQKRKASVHFHDSSDDVHPRFLQSSKSCLSYAENRFYRLWVINSRSRNEVKYVWILSRNRSLHGENHIILGRYYLYNVQVRDF